MTLVKMIPAPPGELVLDAVKRTIAALDLGEKDAAAAKLALEYAENIDHMGPDGLEKLGPKLLTCLESLGATPQARARLKNGPGGPEKPNQLAKLRAARR